MVNGPWKKRPGHRRRDFLLPQWLPRGRTSLYTQRCKHLRGQTRCVSTKRRAPEQTPTLLLCVVTHLRSQAGAPNVAESVLPPQAAESVRELLRGYHVEHRGTWMKKPARSVALLLP
eukprot:459915-Amphidinium_carterae.1